MLSYNCQAGEQRYPSDPIMAKYCFATNYITPKRQDFHSEVVKRNLRLAENEATSISEVILQSKGVRYKQQLELKYRIATKDCFLVEIGGRKKLNHLLKEIQNLVLILLTGRKIRVMRECCPQIKYIGCHQFEPRLNVEMLAESSLHQKLVRNLSILTIHTLHTILQALESVSVYPSETKLFEFIGFHLFQKTELPFSVQKTDDLFYEEKMAPYELPNFASPVFQLSSVRTTSVMIVQACSTIIHLPMPVVLSRNCNEHFRVHMIPSFIKNQGSHFLNENGRSIFQRINPHELANFANPIFQLNGVPTT